MAIKETPKCTKCNITFKPGDKINWCPIHNCPSTRLRTPPEDFPYMADWLCDHPKHRQND